MCIQDSVAFRRNAGDPTSFDDIIKREISLYTASTVAHIMACKVMSWAVRDFELELVLPFLASWSV